MAQQTSNKSYRPAKQSRGRRTEEKFLETAEEAFRNNGFAKARVADIIKLSGCSTGSFYHRFSDKRDLFDVMLLQMSEATKSELLEQDLSRTTHGSVQNLLAHYAEEAFAKVNDRRGFYRAAYEISAQDPTVWDRLKDLSILIGGKFAKVAEDYADEIPASNKTEALQHAVQIIITMAIHTSLGSGPLLPENRTELRKVVIKAALGVLV